MGDGLALTIPNLITIARLLLVPLLIWLIIDDQALAALGVLVIAGLSDAVDGFLARQLNLRSDLGTLLDPLADKALLVSMYVTLTYVEALPIWITILVVSRDVFIIGGVVLSWMLGEPMKLKPHWSSKLNTVLQIVLAGLVLADLAFPVDLMLIRTAGIYLVGIATVVSAAVYLVDWVRHMAAGEATRPTQEPPR